MGNVSFGKWQERAAKLFISIVIIFVTWITFKYFSAVILPFVIAFLIGYAVNGLVTKTSPKSRRSKKTLAFIYLVLFLVLISIILTFTVNRLIAEIGELLTNLEESGNNIISSADRIIDFGKNIISKVPFLRNLKEIEGAEEMLSSLFKSALIKLGDGLTSILGKLLIGTPSTLLSVLICIIASFYFSMDFDNIKSSLKNILSEKSLSAIDKISGRMKRLGKCYLKAYALLFLITFAELFVGLLILGRNYAFLSALIIALVDILPVLGTGIVLVPWGLVMILTKNYFVGFGLLILYAVVTIVRQIAEPHLIGESFGLHPLLSLFSIFAGWKLLGITGVLIAPVIAVAVKELFFQKTTAKING